MQNDIHGHDILDRMIASERFFTRDSLIAFIHAEFGAHARFCTCSAHGMTAAEIVDFLAARGKFAGTQAGFTVNPERVCAH